ncbi:glycosyltransferase [Alphaproteobacteria bacterium]|nr:glycosyltransferase [Alphaproteobacteria bacterium]
MRILHIYKTYFNETHGGVEETIRILANGLYREGSIADVFTLGEKNKVFQFEDHTVYVFKTDFTIASNPFSFQALINFNTIAQKYDVLHFHYPFPYGEFLWLLSKKNKPIIVTYHSDIIKQKLLKVIYRPLKTIFFHFAKKIVYTSPNYLKISDTLSKYSQKLECIPLGINFKEILDVSETSKIKWKKKIKTPFFLFLGALRYYKGLDVLIKACIGFKGNVVLAGYSKDINQWKEKVNALGLKNIYFTGKISENEKKAIISICYAHILPSQLRTEAFGIVQLEAAAHSKALICSNIGTGTTYVNKNNITGIVFPAKDHKKLQNAMNFLLNNPIKTNQMGIAAKYRCSKKFSSETMIKSYVNIYKKLYDN